MAVPGLKPATARVLALLVILVGIAIAIGGVLLPLQWPRTTGGVTWIEVAEVTPGGWSGQAIESSVPSRVALPDRWHWSGRRDVWTYHLSLPSVDAGDEASTHLPEVTQGLWIPRASTVVAIWVDEQLIAGLGGSTLNGADKPLLVNIPRVSESGRQRHAHIVVSGRGESVSGLSSVAHGPMSLLGQLQDTRGAMLTGGGLSVFGATLMMSGAAGWVALHLRSQAVVLFMCATLLMCIREALVFWGNSFFEAPTREVMIHASSGAAYVVSGFLSLRYLEHRAPLWEATSKLLLLLAAPALFAHLLHVPGGGDAIWLWYGLSHAAGLWLTCVVAIEVVSRPSLKRVLLLLSTMGVTACTFLDDWHAFISQAPSSYEFFRLAPVASVSALLSVVVATYLRVFRALETESRYKVELLHEVDRQRLELERLHAVMQQKARAEVAAQERSRIARDLHDGLGSQLIHILTDVEAGEVGQADLVAELNELLDQLRLTMDALDPLAKDVSDLLAQIRYRLKDRWRRAGITLTWSVEPIMSDRHFTPEELTSLQRVLYEVFANIVKHSKARHVAIQTFSDPVRNVCGIVISDDGIGFSPSSDQSGRGMRNIVDRVREMGVAMQLDAGVGHGVTLTLSWSCRSL